RYFSPSHAIDIFGDFLSNALQAEVGRPANVRGGEHVVRENRVGGIERFVPKNVETGAGDAAFFQRCQQGIVVEHRATGDVNDKGGGFHAGKLGLSEQTAGLVIERRRDDDKVRLTQHLVQGVRPAVEIDRHVSRFGAAARYGKNLHGEAGEPPRDLLAD